jgi:hypothetical protein
MRTRAVLGWASSCAGGAVVVVCCAFGPATFAGTIAGAATRLATDSTLVAIAAGAAAVCAVLLLSLRIHSRGIRTREGAPRSEVDPTDR